VARQAAKRTPAPPPPRPRPRWRWRLSCAAAGDGDGARRSESARLAAMDERIRGQENRRAMGWIESRARRARG
jgi:hypothetical protein